ncbi:MAG: sensor histidine kinase, partial [Acutalibacteraceae bacterium]
NVNNDKTDIYSNYELEEFAVSIADNNKTTGVVNNLVYYKTDKDGYILVAFMDNTIIKESMDTVFRYALTIGGAAIFVLFFLSVYLAGRIVKPLEESYKRQKQFISDAGHELKTPVSVVNANADLLAREIGDNQWLANIQYENDRMGALVTQLLELARTENVIPQFEEVDFSRLVRGEALPFESVVFEKGMILICDIAENLKVLGNATQLRQVTSILIDNAVKHALPNSEIVLKLSSARKYAVLSVVNAGNEIPYEERKNIFERFYRVDTARNGDDRHYGLGLAIAKAIAATHNGKIYVNCYDGKVEFTVQIPLKK